MEPGFTPPEQLPADPRDRELAELRTQLAVAQSTIRDARSLLADGINGDAPRLRETLRRAINVLRRVP